MNWVSALTASLFAALGAATANGLVPVRYAGYAALAGAVVQAFQGQIHKPNGKEAQTSEAPPVSQETR